MVRPDVALASIPTAAYFDWPAVSEMFLASYLISAALGSEFSDEAAELDLMRDKIRLTGFAGLPTMNCPTLSNIFIFVNGRPINDRSILSAIRLVMVIHYHAAVFRWLYCFRAANDRS